MKIIITEDQVNLLNEVTNKSVKLLSKYYDIEGSDAYYLGDGKIQTRVVFKPKDFDDPMTPQYGESLCNWNIDKPFGSVIGDLTFKFMDLPKTSNVPLMGYIGNTEELEEYLEDLHRGEAENLIKRINHRRNNPLKESVDKNKKFLINIMGEDLTGKIKEIKGRSDIPKIFHRYLDLNGVKRQIEMVGPKYLVKIRGKYYLYQDQSHFYQSHNDASFGEMFMDEDGKRDRSGKILKELGLDELGLKFSDIINIFYNEEEPLNESVDKNKKFLTNVMGQGFTNNIKQITSAYNVPYNFYRKGTISLRTIMSYLNSFGPMYLFELDGKKYLYQDRFDKDWFIDEDGHRYINNEISEKLGIDVMGLRFSVIIDLYFNEEEPLNEEYDTLGMSKENIKLKNLLKKVLENKELEYSFKDRTEGVWDGNDYEIIYEDYTFKYHMIVNYVLGVGSGSVADIDVIIDDIIVDGESVYDGWVEIGYSENAWYIDKLHDHLNDEFFNSFPFSIYPTFYGHNEER